MSQELLRSIVPAAGYYSEPGIAASLETEVLFGEHVQLLERHNDHLLVKSNLYAKPGYVFAEQFEVYDPAIHARTHRVIVSKANFYHDPSFKSGVKMQLPFNAQMQLLGGQHTPEGLMLQFANLGWVFNDQVRRLDQPLKDYVEVALSRINAGPYTWGGRADPDCSAFVMDTLIACGINCPRNAKEQAERLGVHVEFDLSNLRKGDFVFWTDPGTKARHVVIMTSPLLCVHASIVAPQRGVIEQSLEKVMSDQKRDGNGDPTMIRRFPQYQF